MSYFKKSFPGIFLLFSLILNLAQASEKENFENKNSPISQILQLEKSVLVDHGLLNEALSKHPVTLSWEYIFKIWVKNTVQGINICNWIRFAGIEPLPSRSGSTNPILQYFENRIGYGLAPFNFVFNWQPISEESPDTMLIRGMVKKYNVEILRQKLVEDAQKIKLS